MSTTRGLWVLLTVLLVVWTSGADGRDACAAEPPVAEAGWPRYAALDPVQLDGSGSYDPNGSGTLRYAWTQVSGPPLVISGADTATPTITGFIQTNAIQECAFELVVSTPERASAPDTAKVVIVPYFGASTLKLENAPFDPNKQTVIYFGGGDCNKGYAGQPWAGGTAWTDKANVIDFPSGYTRDSDPARRTYYQYGDMIIAYLSAVAPDYRQSIQTLGWSTGADPALDAGIRLNEAYHDARYAVNRVTHLDGGCRILMASSAREGWNTYLESVQRFLASAVDGEPCWLDHYYGSSGSIPEPVPPCAILWVRTGLTHSQMPGWYRNSLMGTDMNKFNGGLVAGAYWSVLGPGRNLQLVPQPGVYYFLWNGTTQNGAMGFFDLSKYPGRLPEPVALLEARDPNLSEDDPNGIVLTCRESENAVGYQLLAGSDPYDVASYHIVVDSNSPPAIRAAVLPTSDTWWTVKVRDAYGATIYANPVRVPMPAGLIDDVRSYDQAVESERL